MESLGADASKSYDADERWMGAVTTGLTKPTIDVRAPVTTVAPVVKLRENKFI